MTKLRNPTLIRYDLDIQELGKTIKYRAMKVGEQKTILTAVEMKDPKAVINSITDIVQNITDGEIDTSKVPQHIVDYIFMKSYIRSSGGQPKVEYTCGGKIEEVVEETIDDVTTSKVVETPCGNVMPMTVDLDQVEIKYPDDYERSKLVEIDEKMSIKLRIPDFDSFKRLNLDTDIYGLSDQYIFSGVEYILDGEDMIVPGQDFTIEDMSAWMNELDEPTLEKITTFFANIPKLYLKIKVKCPKCGREEVFEFTELEDFFL
jgi:hypothetical protein